MADKKNLSSTSVDNGPALAFPAYPDVGGYEMPPRNDRRYEYARISDNSLGTYNKMGNEGWRLKTADGTWSTWEREIV